MIINLLKLVLKSLWWEVSVHVKENYQEDDMIQIVCKVVMGHSDMGPVDIYWTVPGLQVHQLHKDDLTVLVTDKFSVEEVEMDTVIVSTLMVGDLDSDDTGLYQCRVGQVQQFSLIWFY